MKPLYKLLALTAVALSSQSLVAAPLRVMIASDTPGFRDSYSTALKTAGVDVITVSEPDAATLSNTDVLLMHREKFEAYSTASQTALTEFTKRGGGIVAVNGAIATGPSDWARKTLGGGWNDDFSHKFNSLMMLYVVSNSHPIVKDASPFDITDDTVYDLELNEAIFVLASAFTPKGREAGKGKRRRGPDVPGSDVRASIYDLQPQIWTYETPENRAVVFLQGSPETLAHDSVRTFILRAVAWTAKLENVDEFCSESDLADLRYPAGGPLRAKDAIQQFKMQPGFTASVVAEEPLINKPIAVQWDGAGRMWVAETPEYPNGKRPLNAPAWKETGVLEPGNYDRPGRDSISWLEDTNSDGMMDKKHVFSTGLELVTGFCFHKDGVIAVAQPSIVLLRDVNGDGTAEVSTPLFGGFNPTDTHFVANHFINAPDGWIYASTGSRADATDPKTGNVVGKISPGVFRFRPDGSAIEQVASQGGNTFGCEVTSDLEIFHGKATSGNPIQFVVLPEAVLAKAPNTNATSFDSVNPGRTVTRKDLPNRTPLMQIDQVGRYSAACSTAIYEGGAWPEEYNGTIFTSEPILDVIHHEALKPNGPSFKGELILQDEEWLRSMDYWFCPIDVAFGPDGAMYILDFYTPVVTHNDTRGPAHSKSNASIRPDRDQYFGRIYRIQSTSPPDFNIPDLYQADASALVAAFRHPNKTVRFNAIRILLERSTDLSTEVIPALSTMATDEPFAPARILALWALYRIGQLQPATLKTAFDAAEPAVRKNALLIAEAGGIPLEVAEVNAGLADNDARVRLATLRALGASDMSPEVSSLLLASGKFDDPWSQAAADAASGRNPSNLLETVLSDAGNSGQTEETVRSLAASLASGGNQRQLLATLKACSVSPNPKLASAVLSELGKSSPPAPKRLKVALETLRVILASPDSALASSALPLAAAWDKKGLLAKQLTSVTGDLTRVARDSDLPLARRVNAIRVLLAARAADKKILPNMISLLSKPQPDALSRELIDSLAATGEPDAGEAIASTYPTLPASQQEFAFTALVSRPAFAKILMNATEAGKIDAASLAPGQISRLTSHPDANTAKRAITLFQPSTGKDEIIARLLPEVSKPGNVPNGKVMYSALCATCHQLEGAGNVFGPALDGIGSHPIPELLTHIVNPSLVVDDEHRTWNITMKDGTQYSALIASENEARVQIRQPGGITVDLKPGEIASRTKGNNSLMPEGLDAMGPDNLRDIISYIRSCAPGQ